MPVYNGEKYIKEALDSILAQTYSNFELIIVDNASTDNTPQICSEYTNKDNRVHYYRNKKNIGATLNHNRVFQLSKGELFKWAAHDDVLAPNFLERCIDILNTEPSIILCHSKTGCIDEFGKLMGNYEYAKKFTSTKPHERFSFLVRERHKSWVLFFGVIRASSLKNSSLLSNCIGADRILLAELGLMGRMYEIPEYMFFRRSHPQAYSEKMSHERSLSSKEKLNWWTQTGKINFPTVKMLFEYFRSVRHVPLKFFERFLCYIEIIKWFLREGWLLVCFDIGLNIFRGPKLGSIFQKQATDIARLARIHIRMGEG